MHRGDIYKDVATRGKRRKKKVGFIEKNNCVIFGL